MEFEADIFEQVKTLLFNGASKAVQVDSLVFRDVVTNDRCRHVSLAHLNAAISHISAAKAIYASNYERMRDDMINEVFGLFDAFADEVLACYADNHKHQWSRIHYVRFIDAYERRFAPIR